MYVIAMGAIKVKASDVEKLARLQCSRREIAAFLGVRVSTFTRLLNEDKAIKKAWERGQQMGLISLRRSQLRLAKGNATMGIFLGKNYLGQRDAVVNEHTGDVGVGVDLSKLTADERNVLRDFLTRATRSGGSTT